MAKTTGKVKRVSTKQTLMVLGTAQGKQTFESSRMPGTVRRQVRASFKKASRSTFATKSQAQKAGRAAARRDNVEHVVHRRDGTIGRRDSNEVEREHAKT